MASVRNSYSIISNAFHRSVFRSRKYK
jgi:hypothetical protein